MMNYMYLKFLFTFLTDANDKQFGDVIIQNNKPFISILQREHQK